eukprot:4224909-Ditylum_brightwellii.AAC.1
MEKIASTYFPKTSKDLKSNNFPKFAKEVKDLFDYNTTDSHYKNMAMILHNTKADPIWTF